MRYTLGPFLSERLLRFYFGPDFPGKLRLWGALRRLMGRPRYQVRYCAGASLSLDMDDFIQFELLKGGRYEPEVWDALAACAGREEIFWDVGANVGSVGIRAALDPRVAAVHLFEPNPDLYAILDHNRALNPGLALKTHEIALDETGGRRPLFFGLAANQGLSGLDRGAWGDRSVPVVCRTGDEIVRSGAAPAPTLLKIDVEGAELRVLKGLAVTLREKPPKAIVYESIGHGPAAEITRFLRDFGYESRPFEYPEPRDTTNWIAQRSAVVS